jgi:hypothetical protein
MSERKFSVIIPTMWRSKNILKMLPKYEESKYIYEVIIIDNDPNNKFDISGFSKIKYYTEGKNIFVNPAWNIGALISNYEILLINDDIIIEDIDSILDVIIESDYDIVGARMGKKTDKFQIKEIDNFPKNNYGSFMYVKNYTYVPYKIKVWFGDDIFFRTSAKRGVLLNAGITSNSSSTVNYLNNSTLNEIYLQDKAYYNDFIKDEKNINSPEEVLNVLAVLVNYGDEQLNYLEQVVTELKSFTKYNVTVIVNSNIPLNIDGIDKVNIFNNLSDYQLLPLTCRTTIWENKDNYDIFLFGENDHLFKEKHIDKHLEYSQILPKNRISGLIQYEENVVGKYYPAYHKPYDWDYDSVEIYNNKVFAHFKNIHQATFILTKEQLDYICSNYNFKNFIGDSRSNYSVKCRVNTDIFGNCGFKKLICISEFKDNLIHHIPNVYINGDKGRNKNQRSDSESMNTSLIRLFKFKDKKVICGLATTLERKESLQIAVESIINQVDELYVYQNGYYEVFDFLDNNKITVISSLNTGIDMGDAGKFYTVQNHKDSYYLSIDDDIKYPKDYVTSIVEGLKKFDNNVVVSHHGRSFPDTAKNYYNDYNYSIHFNKKNTLSKKIQFPGTGVMGFYTERFKLDFLNFKLRNIADVIVGFELAKQKIECFGLPHDEKWLVDLSGNKISNTLYIKNQNNVELDEYFRNNFDTLFDFKKQQEDREALLRKVYSNGYSKDNNNVVIPSVIKNEDENKIPVDTDVRKNILNLLNGSVIKSEKLINKEVINEKRNSIDADLLPDLNKIKNRPKSQNHLRHNKGGKFNF